MSSKVTRVQITVEAPDETQYDLIWSPNEPSELRVLKFVGFDIEKIGVGFPISDLTLAGEPEWWSDDVRRLLEVIPSDG